MKRRRFIQLGVGGGLLLGAGGFTLSWLTGGYDELLTAADVPIAMSPKEFAIAKTLVRVMNLGAPNLSPDHVSSLAQAMDEQVWAAGKELQGDMRNALQVLEHAPPMQGILGRFTRLDDSQQQRYLDECFKGGNDTLRQIVVAMKQLCHIVYYAMPESWPALGYDGPLVKYVVPPETSLRYLELVTAARQAAS